MKDYMSDLEIIANEIVNKEDSAESIIIFDNKTGQCIDFSNDKVFDVRSISKTVLALACGILIEKSNNDFNEETLIYPILKDKINLNDKKNLRYLEEVRIKHLLTHTTGYRDLLLMSKDIDPKDYDILFDYTINYPIYYKPGNYFLYSNAGFYLLAATMQEYLGYDLFDFIDENLFKQLNIKDARWERYGDYLAGATKVNLCANDMLSIGKLLMNDGKFNGKQIVNCNWIKKMTKPLFKNSNESKRKFLSEDNYGYGIWISNSGVTFASGTGGQLIVLFKKLEILIITTNSGSDNKGYKIKADVDKIISMINER